MAMIVLAVFAGRTARRAMTIEAPHAKACIQISFVLLNH
jgi:hypothetical protein